MKKAMIGLAAIVLVVAALVRCGTRLPDSVQPIAWSSEACAHCHMLIGDPAFAAQVITTDGDVLSFDDPGCAARYLRQHRGKVHRVWFHDARGQRWLTERDVGFVRVAASPMGYGLMAVPKATADAVTLEQFP